MTTESHDRDQRPLAIVQARMSSSRLPGKVMLDLAGKPLIIRQLERITRAQRLSGIVIATSTDPSDDPLAELLTRDGYEVVRGSLDDVLGRFVQVLDEYRPTTIARITADCPLISPTVIDQVVEAFSSADVDYCSNTLVPTYPDGLDVEIVRADVLR
ncbi:MAG TPA: NTP transferase domain-containing protein, partial [Acidimicrobiia bacterium]